MLMPNPIQILVVDDEPHCRDSLRFFLTNGCPEARIVGEASSMKEAIEMITSLAPDLVLLDIDLGDGTGFDLLDHFPKPDFKVVFTTGHDDFALRAFRYSALDYLLKPIDSEELVTAVRKIAIAGKPSDYQQQLDQLRHQTSTRNFDRLTLNTGDSLVFIRTAEITRLEAHGNFSFVFLENGERHLASQSLAGFEEILPVPMFFRAHQSHVVNTKFVRKFTKAEGDCLLMADKSVIPLARRRKEAFMELMNSARD
jgi:two-component system LytT family response regulator